MFRSRAVLALENLALRHQIGVLQRSASKRPKLIPADRWLTLSYAEIGSGHESVREFTLSDRALRSTAHTSSVPVMAKSPSSRRQQTSRRIVRS